MHIIDVSYDIKTQKAEILLYRLLHNMAFEQSVYVFVANSMAFIK